LRIVELGVIGRILLPVVSPVWLRNYAVWPDKGGASSSWGERIGGSRKQILMDRLGQIKKDRKVKWYFPNHRSTLNNI
jgi:hypothetical protein